MFSRAFSRISGVLLAILVAMLVAACGGGSGNPNNPMSGFSLTANESKMDYGPIVLTVHGGSPPFYFETNSSGVVVPAKSDDKSRTVDGYIYPSPEDGVAQIWVWDTLHGYAGRVSTTITTVATTASPTALTITPIDNSGCTTGQGGTYVEICAGSQAIAELQLGGFGATSGQPVRFSWVSGDFTLQDSTTTVVNTTTDSAGIARVTILTKPGVSTQAATLRVDLPSSSTTISNFSSTFVIVGSNFSIVPTDVSWVALTCPGTAKTAAFTIYGGKPPYTLFTSVDVASVNPSTVSASGGTTTLTVNQCIDGSLTARDSQGNLAAATFSYATASNTTPGTGPDVVVVAIGGTALWGSSASRVTCINNSSFTFTVAGGTEPYYWYTVPPIPGVTFPQSLTGAGEGTVVFGAAPAAANTSYTLYVVDSNNKVSATTPTIYCH
ncbi:MAG: hypothetical protein FWF41_00515 [Betaproteobacteria bacterium]|nr:hypothetical protein [Betaproteobacteria bacterium]